MARICILLPCHWGAKKGGAEYQADCLARYITENTPHEVIYVARNAPSVTHYNGYRIERIPTNGRPEKFGLFLDASALYATLDRLSPDLVIQHVGCPYTGVSAFYCRRRNRPFIWYLASDIDARRIKHRLSPKGLLNRIEDLFLHYGIRNAHAIITQTRQQMYELERNFNRRADSIVPNFHPRFQKRLQKDSSCLNVLWVANLKKLKQPEIFLRLAQFCRDHSHMRFFLIGRPAPSPWCDDLLRQVGKLSNTEYLGELSIEEVNDWLEKADLLVNTSEYEGFPNTFIQAWLREVPVLSLNVDPDDVITTYGLGCHAVTFERMGAWLLAMADNREELARIGARARSFAEEQYSMKNAQKIVDVIDSSLCRNPGLRSLQETKKNIVRAHEQHFSSGVNENSQRK